MVNRRTTKLEVLLVVTVLLSVTDERLRMPSLAKFADASYYEFQALRGGKNDVSRTCQERFDK